MSEVAPPRERRGYSRIRARTRSPMNALITGIAAFFFFALGVICPHDFIYLPALLSVIVVGGYLGGTIFWRLALGSAGSRRRVNEPAGVTR